MIQSDITNIQSAEAVHLEPNTLSAKVKSAATLTLIGTCTLAASGLAFLNPPAFLLAAGTVVLLSAASLPFLLKYGNQAMIQGAVATALVAMGSLIIGGFTTTAVLTVTDLAAAAAGLSIVKTLNLSFLLTLQGGYALPFGYRLLKEGYALFNDSKWMRTINYLHEKIRRSHDPLFSMNTLQIFINVVNNPLLTYQQLDEVERVIRQAEQVNRDFAVEEALLEDRRRQMPYSIHDDLKLALHTLSDAKHLEAVELILKNIQQLVPNWMTIEQFFDLSPQIPERLNSKISHLLANLIRIESEWKPEYEVLNGEISDLEKEINQSSDTEMDPDQLKSLEERHEQLSLRFNKLREAVNATVGELQFLTALQNACRGNEDLLGETEITPLLHFLEASPHLNESLRSFHRTLYSADQDRISETALHRLQGLSNKISLLGEEEAIPAWEYLGAERCGFKTKDYEILRSWLNITEEDDLEEKLNEIGLRNENDLFDNRIIPRQRTLPAGQSEKPLIQENLKAYIDQQRQKIDCVVEAPPVINNPSSSTLEKIDQKIAKVIFRLVSQGVLLVPVLLAPEATAIGVAVGVTFYTLKRFQVPGISILERPLKLFEHIPFFNRHLLSLTPAAETEMNRFVVSDTYGRFRLISGELGQEIARRILFLLLSFEGRHLLGGFTRGFSIGGEIVSRI